MPRLCALGLLITLLSGCEREAELKKPPQQAINDGWMLITISDFDRAEAEFNQAASSAAPGSREFLLARYGLASAYHHRKPTPKYDEALTAYAELVKQDKGGEIGAWAALAIARIHHVKLFAVGREARPDAPKGTSPLPSPSEMDEARRGYQSVIDGFPGTQASDEAAICFGDSLIEQIDPQHVKAGIAFFENWIAQHPKTQYLNNAYRGIASGCQILEDHKGELAALLKAAELRVDTDADRAAEYYRIAYVADAYVHDNATAQKFYQRLLNEFPTDGRVFLCKRGLKRVQEAAK